MMKMDYSMSCTVEFLLNACELSYRIGDKGKIDSKIEEDKDIKLKSFAALKNNKYKQISGIKPKIEKGLGKTPLAAIALMSEAGNGPIVIAFRGTKTMDDVASDYSIAKKGFAQQQHLDGAMAFYKDIKIKYPHREIILTGHSLGGHIATYVCLQAHLDENIPSKGISVRTFNTAPVSRQLADQFANSPDVKSKCINYRLSNDAISSIKFRTYFGNIFNFRSNTSNPVDAHMLWAMKAAIPESVLNTPVSSNPNKTLQENIQGMIHSYECRVKKQFFSSYRLGKKNLAIFLEIQKQIQPLIDKDKLTEANNIITQFNPQLISKESAKLRKAISKLIFEISSKDTGIELTIMNKTGN